MSDAVTSPNRRRRRADGSELVGAADDGPASKKRRAFLQTMGQQLREFGTEGTSPRDYSRRPIGTSPGSHIEPASTSNGAGRQDQADLIDTPESDVVPGEDDQLPAGASNSAQKWLWRSNEVLSLSPTNGNHHYTFQDLIDWSQSYFDHWHPAFPFIHAPSLLDYFRQIAAGNASPRPKSDEFQHVIVRSVLSISMIDRRQMASPLPKQIPSTLIFHSFNDAMNNIQRVLIEETSILSLQALTSVQLFLISMLRYNAAARLEGLAVRMAFQLGLHRCPVKAGSSQSKDAELRKRLFWSIFCIDRYICIRLGIPLGIRSEDIDVCYPHTECHVAPGQSPRRDSRLDLLDFLARHADIRGSIMTLRNRSAIEANTNEDTEALMAIDAEHTKWWNYVDEYLSTCEQNLSIAKVHQITLIVLRFESVIALHRSVLATSNRNPAYNAALQKCISASRSIINTLHKALRGFGAFDGSPGQHGYESTLLLWPSFTWAVWMSAFIVIFAASEKQLPNDVAYRLANHSIEVLQHLKLRDTNWPEACIVAIQNLIARLDGKSIQSTRASTAEPLRQRTSTTSNISQTRSTPRISATHSITPQTGFSPVPTGFIPGADGLHSVSTSFAQAPTEPSVPSIHPTVQNIPFCQSLASQQGPMNIDAFTLPESGLRTQVSNLSSTHLTGTGTFLGIAQHLSDNPIPNDQIVHLFNGEDKEFWLSEEFGFSDGI